MLEREGGVVVEVLERGEGAPVARGDRVTFHFEGRLASTGALFESTHETAPLTIVLGRDRGLAGWHVGLEDLPVGTRARLRIPAALGYGAEGSVDRVPPGSDLVFEVEILSVR